MQKLAIFILVMITIGVFLCSFQIKKVDLNSVAVKLDETACIKGICAVVIVLDHMGLQLSTPIVLKPFTMVGYLCVSIFFFFSGYGLWGGVSNKKGYLNNFLQKKMVKLLCPVVFAKILYGVFFHSKIMYSWYIYVICGLYVLFYCSCKWLSRFDALKSIAGGILLYQVGCFAFSVPVVWYRACWPFFVGCLLYQFKDEFDGIIINRWKNFMILDGVIFILAFLMAALADKFNIKPVELETLITVLFYIVSSIAFVLGVYGFTFGFSMTKVGKILRKAGNVSYEIYLIHGFVFLIMSQIKKENLYPYLVMVATFFFAECLHILSQGILKKMPK